MVVDDDTGKAVASDVRTSSGMFLQKKQVGSEFLAIFLVPATCRLQIELFQLLIDDRLP